MTMELSFTRTQWWLAITGLVLLFLLSFGVGFVGGAMWQRSRETPPAPSAAPLAPAGAARPGG